MIIVWGPADDPPADASSSVLSERGDEVLHSTSRRSAPLRYDITLSATDGLDRDAAAGGVDSRRGLRPASTCVSARTPGGVAARQFGDLARFGGRERAVVVNRPAAGRSNWSKPFQSAADRGRRLPVPDTLVTTDPDAPGFLAEHGRLVYKSISGIRSIVATLDATGMARLDDVVTGPVQLQQWIDGARRSRARCGRPWFATAIDSDADDYRYGVPSGATSPWAARHPGALGRGLVALAGRWACWSPASICGCTDDDEWVCFEINPSPGFTFYEDATGQPIAAAIADLLSERRGRRRRPG